MKKCIVLVLGILLFYSCEEIVSVPDISEELITLIAPTDDAVLESGEVTFSWEEIEFADQYQFQIAEPNFAQANQVVVDTILGDSTQTFRSFRTILPSNNYQWRVRGFNDNFQTDFTTQSFEVDTLETAVDISDQLVTTLAPADNAIVTEGMIQFNWETIAEATEYQLQIAYPDFENPIQVIRDTTLTSLSYTTALEVNSYQWRIKAINETSETVYTTRNFIVVADTDAIDISDEVVTIIAPINQAEILEGMINFNWETVSDATMYQLQIAYPNFENAIQIVEDISLSETSHTTALTSNTYEWRVKAVNDISETLYTTQTLVVVEEFPDLSDQMVVIIAPEDNFETMETMVNLSWEELELATLYTIIITDISNNSVFLEETTTATEITVDFVPGMYTWEVRAENDSQNTPYTQQTITILE